MNQLSPLNSKKLGSNWDIFWKDKGEKMEWSPEDNLNSKTLKELSKLILKHLKKTNLDNLELIELGSGMGITSLYFGHNGIKVTLLDKSLITGELAKKYWGNYGKHKFICADLFDFKTEKKYDIVTSWGLCEHFINEERINVLQKHVDLLKNKGVAIISVPYKYGLFYRIAKFFSEKLGFWDFGIEVPFSKKELISFAKNNGLEYEIIMSGFYGSAYDLFVRKPLKIFKINIKRRFDSIKSNFDNLFGSGLIIVLKK